MPMRSVRTSNHQLQATGGSDDVRTSRTKSLLMILAASLFFVSLPSSVRAQNYLAQTGSPTFTTAEPVDLGFVNAGNGNVHIEIPVVAIRSRQSAIRRLARL